jgi:predicted nucleic acid-binding protein
MKTYWDSSALVEAVGNAPLLRRLQSERAATRPHSLAEVFSALTGNPHTRIAADHAAAIIAHLSRSLDFTEITALETLKALKSAGQKGVRGGRVHDYLHAVAAEKSGAQRILTLDQNDFSDLTSLPVEQA